MKFYLGSQTSDCTVTLVFGKMVILDIWRNYVCLLMVLSMVLVKRETQETFGFQIICI